MGALDLLLSRRAAAAGVGIGTRENRILPPPDPTPAIPGRIGTGRYKVRKPKDTADDIFSPLTETSFTERTYHDATRVYSHNWLLSVLIRPTKTLTVTSGGGEPRTLKVCLAHESTPASGALGDLLEVSRTASVDWLIKQTNANLSVSGLGLRRLFFAYDRLWTAVTFQRQGRLTVLGLTGSVDYPELHGIVAGTHDLALLERDSGRIRSLSWKRQVSDTLLYLVTQPTYTVLENLHGSAVGQAGTTYETLRRFAGFSGEVKGFHCSTGFYTGPDLTTLLYSASSSAPLYASSRPRLFRFRTADDLVYGDIRIPADAIFNNGVSAPVQGAQLGVASGHIYRDANGVVWNITISYTWNSSARTHSLTVIVNERRDNVFETRVSGSTVIGSGTFADEGITPGLGGDPATLPTGGRWIRSLPDGSAAMFVLERRCLVRIDFSGVGTLPSGAGISAALTYVPRILAVEYSGPAGYGAHHERIYDVVNAYPRNDGTFDLLRYERVFDDVIAISGSYEEGWDKTGSSTFVRTWSVGSESVSLTSTTDAGASLPPGPPPEISFWQTVTRITDGVPAGSPIMSTSPAGDMYFDWDDSYVFVRPDTGPITVTAMPYYVYQGKLVPYGTDYRRVAIDVRNETVHIASSNAAAGVFY